MTILPVVTGRLRRRRGTTALALSRRSTMRIALVLAAALVSGAPAAADTLPLISAPATYTNGSPFSLQLRAPNVVDFTSFHVDLIVATNGPDPDAIPNLNIAAVRPDAVSYPFGAT